MAQESESGLSRRALMTLLVLVVLVGAAFPLAHALSSSEGKVTTRLTLQRATGPTGASELIAYVRTKGGTGTLGTGDVLRLRCTEADGSLALRTTRPLTDDRGIFVPHIHVQVAPEALDGITSCHGAGGGLRLQAALRSPFR